ncbi:hypothetical protein [Schleiferilactobacillus perolens]|jgi:uncharacterized membrane protein YeaQ/YmgE (transglycosylase-associated protein family)|uniref:Uncharacterized protein n=1 Tax=Schleiferilactobacillus perolens DSM 12744 TaxID=1423792 RepID=A0A0R1N7T5_9LACO|nr:hypothetical protein [Schleiferilactobacillus perolens]KRL13909.1 hypothetical protein FD09_GL001942 [Schleiferilactobacillus perolens DSM 12744]MCI1892592.1 hypothetical protein [Schleiferilactobacillus harbinensis]MCI2171203.1 hypothetical protein [Schleiferilactobacillus perolens]
MESNQIGWFAASAVLGVASLISAIIVANPAYRGFTILLAGLIAMFLSTVLYSLYLTKEKHQRRLVLTLLGSVVGALILIYLVVIP